MDTHDDEIWARFTAENADRLEYPIGEIAAELRISPAQVASIAMDLVTESNGVLGRPTRMPRGVAWFDGTTIGAMRKAVALAVAAAQQRVQEHADAITCRERAARN
jgi:hypothetical protein